MLFTAGIIVSVTQVKQLFSDSLEVIAHRGNSGYFPENTMAAYHSALDLGCRFIEVDMQLSADNVPVLIHDPRVDRVSHASGRVSHMKAQELRQLDVGSWFAPSFAGETVPMLQDLAELLEHETTGVLLELKGDWQLDDLATVRQILADAGMTQRVLAQSFSKQTVAGLQTVAPELSRGLLIYRKVMNMPHECAELGVTTGNPDWKSIKKSPEIVHQMHADNRMVMSYTLNKPKQWLRAQSLGINAVFTDFPEAMMHWRAAWRTAEG